MRHLILKNKILLLSILVILGFSGCSKPESSLEEPIDTTITGGSLDRIASSTNGVTGQDGSMSNSTKSRMQGLEQQLSVVNFEFDQFEIVGSMEDKLTQNGALLNGDNFSANKIKLEGNCDEWGSDEYNYALGLKRAKATKEYLVSEGVDRSRVSIISFGESNPTCQAKTKSCWYKNRRVDTKLLP